jgi:hypothetical protein
MFEIAFANGTIKDKHVRKLVAALENAGLQVTVTKGKQHIRVENPETHKVVNILRDLKIVGFQ